MSGSKHEDPVEHTLPFLHASGERIVHRVAAVRDSRMLPLVDALVSVVE